MLAVETFFVIGLVGLPLLGVILGVVFHFIAKSIPPSRAALRKRSRKMLDRMVRLKSLLGLEPALSPTVGEVLDEAARLYLKVSAPRPGDENRGGLWDEARAKAVAAMEDAMSRMLQLVEHENPQAQEIELSRGWAQALLEEMKSLERALEEHDRSGARSALAEPGLDALAGLRDARVELERLDSAAAELELRDTAR
jgi:hypothetical protein